jgi:hypothetical protein
MVGIACSHTATSDYGGERVSMLLPILGSADVKAGVNADRRKVMKELVISAAFYDDAESATEEPTLLAIWGEDEVLLSLVRDCGKTLQVALYSFLAKKCKLAKWSEEKEDA